MILIHYSTTEGLEILTPTAGPEFPGNGAERKRADDPAYLPRWYGYVFGTRPEPRIAQRPYTYLAVVNSADIYDLDADPEQLRQPDPTATERAIWQAGYRGYRSAYGIVAVFYATPVTPEPRR